MTQHRLFRLGGIAFATLLVLTLALLVLRPPALDADALRATMTRKLSNWSGGQLAVSGPVRISYFPTIAVEAEKILISAPGRLPMVTEIAVEKLRIETGLLSLLWPNADFEKLILEGATVGIRKQGPATELAAPQKDEFRLLQALKDSPVEWLVLRRSRIVVSTGEKEEILDQINSDIKLARGTGATLATGKLIWRDRQVSYTLMTEAPQIDKGTAAIPLRLKLETPVLTATLDARAAMASGMQLAGKIELNISDLGQFARWMGLLLPEDNKAHLFTASGKFDWDKDLIGFDDGSFSINGNRAIGAMALKLGGARPQIEGTLAFQKLKLASFLADANTPKKPPSSSTDSFTWMHHVDLDLRISTVSLIAPSLEIGQAAISTVLRAGLLDADFAVLDLCGGKANGRLEYNAAVADGRGRLVTSIDELSAKHCLTSLTGASPLRGLARIAADISSDGRNLHTILQKLSGNISLSMSEGEVDVDIPNIAALAAKGNLRGWRPLMGRSTALSTLDGKIVINRGSAYSDSIKLVTADKSTLTGEGTVDLISGDMDYHVILADQPPPAGTAAGKVDEKKPSRLHISGSITNPIFQIERVRAGDEAERHAANID